MSKQIPLFHTHDITWGIYHIKSTAITNTWHTSISRLQYIHCGLYMKGQCSIMPQERSIHLHYVTYLPQGRGLLKLRSLFFPWPKCSILKKCMLDSSNHIHIWQVSPQLSCGDTCQILMRYLTVKVCFWQGWKIGKLTEWRKLSK